MFEPDVHHGLNQVDYMWRRDFIFVKDSRYKPSKCPKSSRSTRPREFSFSSYSLPLFAVLQISLIEEEFSVSQSC
ncbi:unnamed protein product [Lactuca virosa]|uniref:Uncharacterized protein n=1 Tax=Lactuca virosa TaxID=75947 RepID=A0AAU9NW14_9ASTR|nr:unnamed protein product [Lactuca virosa]